MTTIEALGAWGAYDRDDPFPVFADVRELGAVHPVTLADGHDAWLVVGYDEARSALNDRRFSKDMHAALASGGGVVAEGLPGPTFARHMLTVDPPDHSRLRRLVSLAFTPRRVERLLPGVQALVETKQQAPDDALVSALIAARDGNERLTTQELLSTIFQLIVAGHDTTASLIGNGVVALLRHPDQLDEMRTDPEKLAAAVEELLRFDAPVPHATFRYAVAPVTFGDVTIPVGAQVIISLAAANRDRHQYADPNALDIGRAQSRHLAFGYGIHFCLGAPLARMEGQVAFGSLLRRFPELRLAVPFEELRWGHGDGLVLRGLTELPVIPGPSTPTR